jgi:hypothetical protein
MANGVHQDAVHRLFQGVLLSECQMVLPYMCACHLLMPVRKVCFKMASKWGNNCEREDRNLLIPLCTESIFTKIVNAEKSL